jgi:hypothetical protein
MAVALLAMAASALLFLREEPVRTITLTAAGAPVTEAWSDQVTLEALGSGQVRGTSQDVVVDWVSGTVRAIVEPNTGTQLAVVTEEARVQVIGTVFAVRRDLLGTTVDVERGRVRVDCEDGWAGDVTPEFGSHTCLPTTAGTLLGRADALMDRGVDQALQRETLDAGLILAEGGTAVEGELLVRRMRLHGDLGRIDDALADADLYLNTHSTRSDEVQRFAGWLALAERGCDAAVPYLTPLQLSGATQETVLLAECIAPQEPVRARRMLTGALVNEPDAAWTSRIHLDLEALR